MKVWRAAATWISFLFLLTGCWDKAELSEYGYVQGVAIDRSERGKIKLTPIFYTPSGGESADGGKQKKGMSVSLSVEEDTVMKAIRDIPYHLGRKAKWDHMRVILISDKLAQKQSVGDVMDFFSRNHEPRATITVLIAQGKASEYLKLKPFIENTMGQQLRRMEEYGYKYSAKTSQFPLIDLTIQLKSQTGSLAMPIVSKDPANKKKAIVSGMAILREGKMTKKRITPDKTPALLMLQNKYKGGVVELPCPANVSKSKKESVEIINLSTKVKPEVRNGEVSLSVKTEIEAGIGELVCSALRTEPDEIEFEKRVEDSVRLQMEEVMRQLQKQKADVIGVGDRIYRKNPKLWKSMKPGWPERFSGMEYKIEVTASITNTGMNAGLPYPKGGGE